MKAFLIDPLKPRDQVVFPINLEDDLWVSQIQALLGLGSGSTLEEIHVGPASWDLTLVVAGSAHFEEVRRLGEFRIEKSSGDYRSVAGRGVILGHEGEASQLQGLLSSFGVWVSA